jgi:hypothetical protein
MIPRWSPGQWVLRAGMVVGLQVALLATVPLGVTPHVPLVLVVAALSLAYARVPEGVYGTVAMGFVIVWWGISLRDALHPWALLAGAGLLASHAAGIVAAYGPDELRIDRATVRLWATRAAAAYLLVPLLGAVALGLRDQPEAPGIWVAGLVSALAATLVAAVAFTATEA